MPLTVDKGEFSDPASAYLALVNAAAQGDKEHGDMVAAAVHGADAVHDTVAVAHDAAAARDEAAVVAAAAALADDVERGTAACGTAVHDVERGTAAAHDVAVDAAAAHDVAMEAAAAHDVAVADDDTADKEQDEAAAAATAVAVAHDVAMVHDDTTSKAQVEVAAAAAMATATVQDDEAVADKGEAPVEDAEDEAASGDMTTMPHDRVAVVTRSAVLLPGDMDHAVLDDMAVVIPPAAMLLQDGEQAPTTPTSLVVPSTPTIRAAVDGAMSVLFKPLEPALLTIPLKEQQVQQNEVQAEDGARRSARLAMKPLAGIPMVVKAQINVCRQMGFLPVGGVLTNQTLADYKAMFNTPLPQDAIDALNTLFNLNNEHMQERDEAMAAYLGPVDAEAVMGEVVRAT